MKIGIISMQRVGNYGSFLQAYALKRLIEALGNDVVFVDIEGSAGKRNEKKTKKLILRLFKFRRYFFNRLRYRNKIKKVSKKYKEAQIKHLGLTEQKMLSDGCDAVVIGSDEIFNCDSQGVWEITEERFGYIPGAKCVISYAASCGNTDITNTTKEDIDIIKKGLSSLRAISVRDQNAAKTVFDVCGLPTVKHADPVLVYNFEKEMDRYAETNLPQKPYMIVYAYRGRINSKEEIKAIRSYARQKGLKILSIGGMQAWCDDYLVLDPFRVLKYFKNATCVVTDTFHGTIMGAKFNRPMAVFVRKSNSNKLTDMMEHFHIETHIARDVNEIANIIECENDYSAFNRTVEEESTRTRKYLKEQLSI